MFHGSSQHANIHRCRTGFQKGIGAGPQRGAGGEHIIDQHDTLTGNAFLIARANRKGATDIFPARLGTLATLMGLARAFQGIAEIGPAETPRHRPGQLRGLVEAAMQQPERMQRHRHDDIGLCNHIGAGAFEPAGQHRREIKAVAILEAEDQTTDRVIIDAGRPCPTEGKGFVAAVIAVRAHTKEQPAFKGTGAHIAAVVIEKTDARPVGRRQSGTHQGFRRRIFVGIEAVRWKNRIECVRHRGAQMRKRQAVIDKSLNLGTDLA